MSDANNKTPMPITIRPRKRPPPPAAAPAAAPAPAEPDPPPHNHQGGAEAEAAPTEKHRVGYKSPPLGTRFKPGQSGNPRGRPRGSRNWATVFEEIASRRRTIGIGGRKVRMCAREAIAEQMAIGAMKGDKAARKDFLNEMHRQGGNALPSPAQQAPTPDALSANDKALLADFFKRTAKLRGEDEEP